MQGLGALNPLIRHCPKVLCHLELFKFSGNLEKFYTLQSIIFKFSPITLKGAKIRKRTK